MCSFFVVLYYLHDLVHGAKWVSFFCEVLCKIKIRGLAVVAPCCLMFFVAGGELSSCLSHIRPTCDLIDHIPYHTNVIQPISHKDWALDQYSLSGVYKLTCPDCHKTYVGQTGRQFSARYKEHKTSWRKTSNFAHHLTEETHSFGPMNQIMEIVQYHKKGEHINTIEKFHIHIESAKNSHLNDPQTIHPNAIFDIPLKTARSTDH